MTRLTGAVRVPFTPHQTKILLALAATVGLRMLGLFLVLPVFTLYGLEFTQSRFLVGFAFGAYGLTMALLQIPFGRLSDRIGRRKVLILGMALFSTGSFLCALPHLLPPPYGIAILVLGRLVQGGGAIISVAFAAIADHIEKEKRATAMAYLGIPIGASFVVGIIGGPILAGYFGTAFLFVLTGCLGLLIDFLLVSYLPDVSSSSEPPAPLSEVLKIRPLLYLSAGGFLMNFFMSSFFFHFPLIATGHHHLKMTEYYRLLLPMMLISGITMFLFSRGADRGWGKPLSALAFLIFSPSVILLFHSEVAGFDPNRLTTILIAGTLFYVGFTGLEPVLPSLVSKHSPETAYGTALGLYNSMQFLGSPAGSSLSGALSPSHLLIALLCASAIGVVLMALPPSR